MRRTLTCLAFVAVTCAVAGAQVVQVFPNQGSTDAWGKFYSPRNKLTFSGRVTGIGVSRQSPTGDDQVTLMVQNRDGGGTAEVEIGPKWFVDQQDAKIRAGDLVQVTGSKVKMKDGGVIIASQVRIHGQGGPVLALRRPSGAAYWLPAEVAAKPAIPGDDSIEIPTPPDTEATPPIVVPYAPPVIPLDNGILNVDTNAGAYPYWYNNAVYPVTGGVTVVSGPYPFWFRPFL